MAQFLIQIPTRWPPWQALQYLADLRNLKRWDPSVTRAELLRGEPGQLSSQFEVVVAAGARPLTLHYRTTEASETAVRVVAQTLWLRSDDLMWVEPDSQGGCIVHYDAKLELPRQLRRLDPLLGWGFNRVAKRAATGLRKALQGQPPATSQPTSPAGRS
jgi:hypothetical protein